MTLIKFSNHYPALFERFFDNQLADWNNKKFEFVNTSLPSVNIKENTDEFEVSMAAPGYSKTDFIIELNNDLLTISSEVNQENEVSEGKQFTSKEFSCKSFSRSFTLPNSADSENIAAKYENGILNLVIPKKEEAKPKAPRQIAVD